MSGEAILVTKYKYTIWHLSLHIDIITILGSYYGYTTFIDQFKGNYIEIKDDIKLTEYLNLWDDPLNIKPYIQKRLAINGGKHITVINISRGFDLLTLRFLLDAPASIIDVEHSFSLLEKC